MWVHCWNEGVWRAVDGSGCTYKYPLPMAQPDHLHKHLQPLPAVEDSACSLCRSRPLEPPHLAGAPRAFVRLPHARSLETGKAGEAPSFLLRLLLLFFFSSSPSSLLLLLLLVFNGTQGYHSCGSRGNFASTDGGHNPRQAVPPFAFVYYFHFWP